MAKDKTVAVTEIREAVINLQRLLNEAHGNREISLARTKLDECEMWAVKGIMS